MFKTTKGNSLVNLATVAALVGRGEEEKRN
jgi:hypothetical protein